IRGNRRGVHVDDAPQRVVGVEMAAAGLARLAMARRVLAVGEDPVGALRYLHALGLPQGESVDRRGRPGPAGIAMAVAHRDGLASDFEMDRAAEAASLEGVLGVRMVVRVNVLGGSHGDRPFWIDGNASIRAPLRLLFTQTPRILIETPWKLSAALY